MTAPSVGRSQDRGDKYATGATKIRGRDNITIRTWNVRTLRPDGKLEELSHELDRYQWNIIGLSEARWKFHGEMCTDEGHKLYYSGSELKHEHGVGFIIHKDTVNAVMGCKPVSERLITLRLRASPFNITIIQVYAPTTSHGDDELESLYSQTQTLVDETPKKDILVVMGDWNSKVGEDAQSDWKEVCGPYCNPETNDRGLRLLDFATYNNLVLANTLGQHKPPRRWTWHSPDGNHHNQIDYILVKKRFRSGVNVARTRSFPGADVGSDHDLVMMTFRVRLKKNPRNPNN
ncbi:craniofacial development protein 2-like [Amphiura filiformis]|uniref:craniofacial development protein 2-like n=1 Tax=Amphiura filiformis TaxID=82378 RepID=UPI003B224745